MSTLDIYISWIKEKKLRITLNRAFFKVVAWTGLALMALGIAFSFYVSSGFMVPDWFVFSVWYLVMLLDAVGLVLILAGGLIAKPRRFWPVVIAIGVLHVVSFYPHVWTFIHNIMQNERIYESQKLFFLIALIPGLIAIAEGILLGLIGRRTQASVSGVSEGKEKRAGRYFLRTFFKIFAWTGLGIVALGVVLSFLVFLALTFPGPPSKYPTEGPEFAWMLIIPLDLLGLLLLLIGGLASRPKYLWLASIIIGCLHILVSVPPEWRYLRLYTQDKGISFALLNFFVLPGLIAITIGMLIKIIDTVVNRKRKIKEDSIP